MNMIVTPQAALVFGCVAVLTAYAYSLLKALQTYGRVSGFKPLVAPTSILGGILPRSTLNRGINWQWLDRKTAYFSHTHDIISMIPLLTGTPCFFTCSVDVLKQLLGNEGKSHLIKPLDLTLHSILGSSVASASGEIWRRHRRIVAPAFNSKTYELVIKVTATTYQDMVESEGWNEQKEVHVSSIKELLLKFSIHIVAKCEFGIPMTWKTTTKSDEGLTFEEAITTSAATVIPRLIIPNWAYKLPIEKLREINSSWTLVSEALMTEARSGELTIDEENPRNANVLRRLVASSESEGKFRLTEQEVLANLLTIMFAGHETTASVLTATLGYLAIHQDEQEKARAEVLGKLSPAGDLEITNSAQLPYLEACFQESLRLFPAAFLLGRVMAEDVTVHVQRPTDSVITLPKGSRIIMDLISIYRNSNFYPNPDVFQPSRWLGVSETNVPMFGTGPRACVGRKFAHTEAVCLLALILQDWFLDVDLRPGETRAQYENRVMTVGVFEGIGFSVGPVPITLKRR